MKSTLTSCWTDLRSALAFLTILPIGWPRDSRPGRSFAYYPLVGVVVGGAISIVASIRFLPADLVAFLALLTWVVLTGGLHLDGFGDACDGLLATVEPAHRLEIMKDPRTGTWAVTGLILLLLGKWIALAGVAAHQLILPPIIGRWAMVLAVYYFPYARTSGTGAYFRDGLGRWQVAVATLLTVLVAAACGWPAGVIILVAPITVGGVGLWASHRLGGGLTGDVYGALCELTELLCLVVLNVKGL
ncbi:MAG: adenosylcobinamide-GDP ribazoletransferase [Chloroflexi bacterium]|nr:adenosylcobinamide-GDP ribazoletransferase [Chloroflexota bacterium]